MRVGNFSGVTDWLYCRVESLTPAESLQLQGIETNQSLLIDLLADEDVNSEVCALGLTGFRLVLNLGWCQDDDH